MPGGRGSRAATAALPALPRLLGVQSFAVKPDISLRRSTGRGAETAQEQDPHGLVERVVLSQSSDPMRSLWNDFVAL